MSIPWMYVDMLRLVFSAIAPYEEARGYDIYNNNKL